MRARQGPPPASSSTSDRAAEVPAPGASLLVTGAQHGNGSFFRAAAAGAIRRAPGLRPVAPAPDFRPDRPRIGRAVARPPPTPRSSSIFSRGPRPRARKAGEHHRRLVAEARGGRPAGPEGARTARGADGPESGPRACARARPGSRGEAGELGRELALAKDQIRELKCDRARGEAAARPMTRFDRSDPRRCSTSGAGRCRAHASPARLRSPARPLRRSEHHRGGPGPSWRVRRAAAAGHGWNKRSRQLRWP